MAFRDEFQGLVLKEVTPLDHDQELGRGAYGRVYAVKYCGTICAAKEIHSILVEGTGRVQMQQTAELFMRECRQCSTLRHPNVIQFLGVYYPSAGAGGVQRRMRLPVMVMEMMADNLTSLVDKHEKIPIHVKFSIVHDVSLGLCYLHNHDPPIVHRDLSPNNILLTAHHVAKISDLGVAKVIKGDSRKTMTKAPGTVDFMSPESLSNTPMYGPPMDMFSFAGIVLHTFNQQWPRPSDQVRFDPNTRKMVALSEVERRQHYLNKMEGDAEVLRPLVEECLDNDPNMRPTITAVCERIQVSKDGHTKESPQDVITLYQQVEQLRSKLHDMDTEIKLLKQHLPSTEGVLKQQVASQHNGVAAGGRSTVKGKLKTDSPPLMPTLTSGRYQMKWVQLANLPAPMYEPYVAVQDKKVYVSGGAGPIDDTKHQVYVYDINTDLWGKLPPSGHYRGIPHIIGGKLAIIGGYLSTSKMITNKVSTFDETSLTWTSYYPHLLSRRSKPGVVSHLEHVIVAGGTVNDTTHNDIEILDWVENSHWKKINIHLPDPMWAFTPIISDDHFLIVGYAGADSRRYNRACKLPVTCITKSCHRYQSNSKPAMWIAVTASTHWGTTLVPSSSPPVVIGGYNKSGTPTTDVKMYDTSSKSWKIIASLSSPRSYTAVATINNNAVIIIGGCTTTGSMTICKSSSQTTVELGQPEPI